MSTLPAEIFAFLTWTRWATLNLHGEGDCHLQIYVRLHVKLKIGCARGSRKSLGLGRVLQTSTKAQGRRTEYQGPGDDFGVIVEVVVDLVVAVAAVCIKSCLRYLAAYACWSKLKPHHDRRQDSRARSPPRPRYTWGVVLMSWRSVADSIVELE